MSKSKPAPLSKAQTEIMEIIWEQEEVTVSEVWETLSQRRPVARNTVQTMMVRLEEKGWLKHRTLGRSFLYSAVSKRSASLGESIRHSLETMFGGSTEDLVTAILEDQSLTKSEANRIRQMIDEAEKRNRRKENDS